MRGHKILDGLRKDAQALEKKLKALEKVIIERDSLDAEYNELSAKRERTQILIEALENYLGIENA